MWRRGERVDQCRAAIALQEHQVAQERRTIVFEVARPGHALVREQDQRRSILGTQLTHQGADGFLGPLQLAALLHAAGDVQHEGHRQRLGAIGREETDLLGRAALENPEVRFFEPADDPALAIGDTGLEHHHAHALGLGVVQGQQLIHRHTRSGAFFRQRLGMSHAEERQRHGKEAEPLTESFPGIRASCERPVQSVPPQSPPECGPYGSTPGHSFAMNVPEPKSSEEGDTGHACPLWRRSRVRIRNRAYDAGGRRRSLSAWLRGRIATRSIPYEGPEWPRRKRRRSGRRAPVSASRRERTSAD